PPALPDPLPPSPARREQTPSGREPVGLPDRAHRLALHLRLEPFDVELAVEVVGLVLQCLRHEPVAFEHDLVAVDVDAGDARPGVPHPREVEAGHREAAFVDGIRFAVDLEHGVDDVGDVTVDVDAERPQPDADLGRGDPGASRRAHAVDEVLDERAHAGVAGVGDRVGLRAEYGVAEEADLSFGHAFLLVGSPSMTSAASSRAEALVKGCRFCQRTTEPAASSGSYGIRTTARTREEKCASISSSLTRLVPWVAVLIATTAFRTRS